ncbi:MAG: type I 3-dehydroquinate dehydratase, partial [Terriglobales bacterium]
MTASPNSFATRLLHQRLPRVCVAVTGADASDMVEKAEALAHDNPFIEFRLDYLAHPALALPKIKKFTDHNPHVTAIATCRRVASDGKFRGSIASQLDILAKSSAAGCQLVDVELQSAVRCNPQQLNKLRSKAA